MSRVRGCYLPGPFGAARRCAVPDVRHLLWFIRTSHGMRLYPVDGDLAFREKLAKWAEAFVAIEAIDSLDVVELVMEIEGDFGVTIPDEEAENIKSTGDLLDYLVRLHLKGPTED